MRSIEKVHSLMNRSGIEIDLNRFEHRILVQKITCLLELKGIDLGYRFSMYLRGPYSPDLTRDLFDHGVPGRKFTALSRKEEETVDELKQKLGTSPVDLEIAATYGFLRSREGLGGSEAIARTRSIKPYYSNSRISLVISRTNGFLFEPSKEELEDMKEEARSWERATFEDTGRSDR